MTGTNKATTDPFLIHAEADLEIAVLYEAHDLLASIISPFLYHVSGHRGEQQAVFESSETFELFAIRVGEFLAESGRTVAVPGAPANLSLLSGLEWAGRRLKEPSTSELRQSVDTLGAWMKTPDDGIFWCGALGVELCVRVERRQLWKTYANLRKHTPFRLGDVMRKLQRWTAAAGRPVAGPDVPAALEVFHEWLQGYTQYHATMVAELLGHVFLALNRVVQERGDANGRSNDSSVILHPAGATPAFESLHTSLLVSKRYEDARITDYVPDTAPNLRRPYRG